MKRKVFSIILTATVAMSILWSCGGDDTDEPQLPEEKVEASTIVGEWLEYKYERYDVDALGNMVEGTLVSAAEAKQKFIIKADGTAVISLLKDGAWISDDYTYTRSGNKLVFTDSDGFTDELTLQSLIKTEMVLLQVVGNKAGCLYFNRVD